MRSLFAIVDSVRAAVLGHTSRARAKKTPRKRPPRVVARLSLEHLESRTLLDVNADMMAIMALVPNSAVTDTAAQNGPWSSPSTWQSGHLPADNANVLIPMGLSVTVDDLETARLHTLRVDGTLQFATNANTSLLVDTIVVMSGGTFQIGTSTSPIAASYTATVTFTDSAPVDTTWDPLLFSRGLLSMGVVSMYGQTVTSFVGLAKTAHAGDTELKLAQAPTNWQVGDQLVLPGTAPGVNQDETPTILDISGKKVTVSALAFDHAPPAKGLTIYVANLRRNVILQSENPSDVAGRGHTMFMTQTTNIDYVALYSLGRTNKLLPVTDPQLDASGHLIPGTGANPRGRYAIHFHHTGTDASVPPASVVGAAVIGSPGWGFVNHDSYVNFLNNVSDNVVGAGFVTESGSEIGSFVHNLAIRDTGSGEDIANRKAIQDFGHDGDGFWFQGPGVKVQNNIAVGQVGAGFVYYTLGLVDLTTGITTVFSSANLPNPAVANGQPTVDVYAVPIRLFKGNVTYGSIDGLADRNNLKYNELGVSSVIDSFRAWNIRRYGVYTNYTDATTVQNSWLIGSLDNPAASDVGIKTVTEPNYNITLVSNHVEGWHVGIDLWPWGTQTLQDGYLNNIRNVMVHLDSSRYQGQTVTITGTKFGTLSPAQLQGRKQYNVYLDGSFAGQRLQDLAYLFAPQSITVNAGPYSGQLYFNEQAADYIPFPSGSAPSWVPTQLIGLTNQQLWSQYGLAVGGAVAPAGATTAAGLNALIGSATTFPPTFTMLSNQTGSTLVPYVLIYLDGSGKRVVDPNPVNLSPGWNPITRTINGVLHTFFVYGGSF